MVRTTTSSRSRETKREPERAPGRTCAECGSKDLGPGKIEQVIVVDGRKQKVMLTASICQGCGHYSVSGKELRRASAEIRKARGDYSGRFIVRIDPDLHRRLSEMAAERTPPMSLNQLVQEILEKGAK